MAKFGNCVGEESLSFNQDEINTLKKHFKAILSNNSMNIDFYMRTNYLENQAYIINFDCKKIEKRNRKQDRIYFNGLTFIIRKQKGYLDITDWNKSKVIVKDYLNAPNFQYSAEIICDGKKINYRCRNKYRICLKNSYLFDTEISELNFKDALIDLFNQKLR